jgi:hypothetical protein
LHEQFESAACREHTAAQVPVVCTAHNYAHAPSRDEKEHDRIPEFLGGLSLSLKNSVSSIGLYCGLAIEILSPSRSLSMEARLATKVFRDSGSASIAEHNPSNLSTRP